MSQTIELRLSMTAANGCELTGSRAAGIKELGWCNVTLPVTALSINVYRLQYLARPVGSGLVRK